MVWLMSFQNRIWSLWVGEAVVIDGFESARRLDTDQHAAQLIARWWEGILHRRLFSLVQVKAHRRAPLGPKIR